MLTLLSSDSLLQVTINILPTVCRELSLAYSSKIGGLALNWLIAIQSSVHSEATF